MVLYLNILQVCAYAANYEGNFIKSLRCLDNLLKEQGHNTMYAFPENAQDIEWCAELSKTRKVFFLPLAKARIKPETYKKLKKIMRDNSIDIVHSHFELYDIPCNIMSPKNTKVFWHLHDPIKKSKKRSRNILNTLQYKCFSKNCTLISVSDHYKDVVIDMGFNRNRAVTVLNGIDLCRISYPYEQKEKRYDFVTFGWDFKRKGSDIIFNALSKLYVSGYKFKLLFNCNESTITDLNNFWGSDKYPEWLEVGMPVEDINTIFSETDTFIQSSRRETFSYAVCEAAYAGLSVIASDIYGLEWAHEVPTVTFFENEDVDGLFNLLKNVLDKKSIPEKNQINDARNIIESKFSTAVWAKNIIEIYNK